MPGKQGFEFDDSQILKSYINPSHGVCDPVGFFSNVKFLVCGEWVCNLVWYIVESKMFTRPLPESDNDCECKCSKRTLLDNCAPLGPFVNIQNVAKWIVFNADVPNDCY